MLYPKFAKVVKCKIHNFIVVFKCKICCCYWPLTKKKITVNEKKKKLAFHSSFFNLP